MNKHQEMVEEMMKLFKQNIPEYPQLNGYPFILRAKLIHEEALEFLEAAGVKYKDGEYWLDEIADWPKMIDALCDILVVTYGAASAMGIDIEPYFAEVHRTNMMKAVDGKIIRRESDNKVLKPEGWEPPSIVKMLADDLINSRNNVRDEM